MKQKPKISLPQKARDGFIKFSSKTHSALRYWNLSDEQVKALSTRLELFAIFLFSQNFFTTFENPIANFVLTALAFMLAIWTGFLAFILKGFKK